MTDARIHVDRTALAEILDAAAAGRFPPADGAVTILPQPSARDAGVIAFTAHSVLFTDAEPAWVSARLPAADLSAALSPRFLHALAEHTGRVAHSTDVLTCAWPLPGPPSVALAEDADPAHPRIARALRYRDDVRAWQADGGVVLIGRGLGGRWEVAVEVDQAHRGRGLGRELALAARQLMPAGAPLWAQIAPGNAASVRAFLAAGYRPVGAEALLSLETAGQPDLSGARAGGQRGSL
ncbi:MAG TPA: GNAT family N-acetyltransferase [Streptosporangiaceae bacterium]|nr:GNAT family N-acetyltransferase [Streptosporangiaceae bacterium]